MTEPAPVSGTTDAPKRQHLSAQLSGPLRRYLATESGSAALLVAATLVALVWANSPFSSSYEELWHTMLSLQLGEWELALDLRHWIDEGLMALFFFVVGLEVRREWSMGELTERRRATLPLLGAIGGMLVPVVFFLALNPSGEAAGGWGIVIATDTAFLLGALALLGPSTPTQLRVFLLTLSIVDDMVAISVIGIVYAGNIDGLALLLASLCLVGFWALGRLQVRNEMAYLALWCVLWVATLRAGLHPTIAGMAAGLLITAYPPRRSDVERAAVLAKVFRQSPMPEVARDAKRSVERSISPNERLITFLHPITGFVIVPLFALASAGIDLRGGALADALQSPLTWGIVLALCVGKTIGISLGALVPRRFGWGELPRGVGAGQVVGGAALSGIGFTVSLLIADLAFESERLATQAKVGVLLAVVGSVVLGWLAFEFAARRRGEVSAGLPTKLDGPVDPQRDRLRGRADAPMVLVEYGDFECSFCGRATGMVEELHELLGDDFTYVFRHLPLEDVHSHAFLASEAAEAAHDQGRFWDMHDLLFRNYDDLEYHHLLGYAQELGLDVEQFSEAIDSGVHAARIREDVASAEASGARGTPTFYVNGERHVGPYDTARLAVALQAARA
ncbi:MAG: Na+/H+ antiporter NhaA [Thermoleophilia bacterium]|jgi:Na+/H+ antiporter NhaA|nr:Na+/H+ antiporter NhaA [Thermoleophilia bacterium]